MLHFLSPEALYGLLLVTTFASVGLLGLWAATSRAAASAPRGCHWLRQCSASSI